MSKAKTVAFLGIFTAVALMLSYIESLIPINFGIPGVKLGLANLMVVFLLYYMKPGCALIVNIVRILISGLLFGSVFGIIYSTAGALLSFLVMWPMSRTKIFSPVGVSAAGGVTHNMGQLLIAMVLLGTKEVILYLPVLVISGLATGVVMGLLSDIMIKNIRRARFFNI